MLMVVWTGEWRWQIAERGDCDGGGLQMGRRNGLITEVSKQPGVEHDLVWLKRRNGSMFPRVLAGSVTRYPVLGKRRRISRGQAARRFEAASGFRARLGEGKKIKNWDYTLKSRPNWWAGPLSLWWKGIISATSRRDALQSVCVGFTPSWRVFRGACHSHSLMHSRSSASCQTGGKQEVRGRRGPA